MRVRKYRFGPYLAILTLAAVLGALYGAALDHFIRSDISLMSFLRGGLRGLVLGAVVLAFEILLGQSPVGQMLRRAPFLVSLSLRTLATTFALMVAIVFSRWLFSSRGHPFMDWVEAGLLRDFLFVVTAAFAVHVVEQTRRIVGTKTLFYFLLGRYNRPLVEERIFLLTDIVGSTAMAERLGDTRALELISRFFFDISADIGRYDGETDNYIGDEVVVSWPLGTPAHNAGALLCYLDIQRTIARTQHLYSEEYGESIAIRAGLHGGPVAVGECGDEKRQVVFIGDTINTAKRLQEACKELGVSILVSGGLLDRTDVPAEVETVPLGAIKLRGRSTETRIFTFKMK